MRAMQASAITDSIIAPKAASVASADAEDELPEITEALVATLSEQASFTCNY
jgi:hypothetical protein